MENTNIKLHQKNISRIFPISRTSSLVGVLFLVLLGMLAIVMHAKFRMPMNLPGRHGLEFMALLVIGRMSCHIKWASSISSIGMSVLLLFPVLGFKDPFMGFTLLLPGFLMDVLYNSLASWQKKGWFIAIIAGLSYMMIPLGRIVISLTTNYPYESFLKHGFVIPFLTHVLFGVIGGLLGVGIITSFKLFKKSS